MENSYEISKDLRELSTKFLSEFANYEKCLSSLKDTEKESFTESEVNEILNLLGAFRLREVFHIVERYKVDVTQLKSESGEESGEQAEK
jgi:hypothetical protein